MERHVKFELYRKYFDTLTIMVAISCNQILFRMFVLAWGSKGTVSYIGYTYRMALILKKSRTLMWKIQRREMIHTKLFPAHLVTKINLMQ